jgi:integrase/recombinase XerD
MSLIISLVFRYDKKNDSDIGPIYLRLTKNRKVSYISTGKRIHEKYWDKKASKVKPSYPNSSSMNNHLTKLRLEYEEKFLKEESNSFSSSVKTMKSKINGIENVDFFSISNSLLKRYYASGKIGTHDKTKSIAKKIERYCKKSTLSLIDITPKFLSEYELYLRQVLNNKTNTVKKDMNYIKRVFNEAYRHSLIEHNQIPFNRYNIKSEKTHKLYLSQDEVNKISLVTVSGKVKIAKDMFIFSSYVGGIRVSDTLLLQCKDFDGTFVHFQIQKTKGQLSIKVPNKALAILSEYVQNKDSNDFVFPMLPNALNLKDPVQVDTAITRATAIVNKNLKTIASLAGINKRISFHTARHTWATLALQKGISLDKVSKLMGHASVRETQIYAKIVNEDLHKAMESFNE